MTTKPLPHSVEAERGFLGACLLDATFFLPKANDADLQPEDFYIPAHSIVWEGIQVMAEGGLGIDSLTLEEHLKKTKKLDLAGGSSGLDGLVDACITPAYGESYLKVIKEKSQLRKIYWACAEAQAAVANEGDEDPEQIINTAQEALFRCSKVADETPSHGELANILIRRFNDAKKGIKPGLDCFLEDMNTFLGCYKYAGLYFYASEPGLGKSTYLQQQAKIWSKDGIPVAAISLEMRLEDYFGRILCEEADVSMFALEQGISDIPGGTTRLGMFVEACRRWIDEKGNAVFPLYMTDKRMNVIELASWVRMMHKRFGIKAVTIDYLQLLHAPSNKKLNSDAERIAYTVDMLRDLAKELNIIILVAAQFDKQARQAVRGGGKQGKRRPQASDIRGSSVIEDAAWGILMMYRWIDDETGQEDIIVDLVKHRSGSLGMIKLNFIRNRQRMESAGVAR